MSAWNFAQNGWTFGKATPSAKLLFTYLSLSNSDNSAEWRVLDVVNLAAKTGLQEMSIPKVFDELENLKIVECKNGKFRVHDNRAPVDFLQNDEQGQQFIKALDMLVENVSTLYSVIHSPSMAQSERIEKWNKLHVGLNADCARFFRNTSIVNVLFNGESDQ